jgi:hypothetical protein
VVSLQGLSIRGKLGTGEVAVCRTCAAHDTETERKMKFPQPAEASGVFAETNPSANRIVKVCGDMLALFGYSLDQLVIELDTA